MALRGGIIAHYRGVGSVYDSRAFSMYWREGKNLSHKKYLLELSRISGLEPQEFMDAINADTIMNKLNENIKTATHHGVFDVPTFVVEEQLFWGIDRLNFLASFIKKN